VRVRENSEQIALLKGEPAETERLVDRFGRVVANWLLIMKRTKRLTFFTAAYSQVSIVFPMSWSAPAYFASKMQLGGLMQTASAFNSVQTRSRSSSTCIAHWRSGGRSSAAGWVRLAGGGGEGCQRTRRR
jgi:putative ATP-binding cassette transporter